MPAKSARSSALDRYKAKRDFSQTAEPQGKAVQKRRDAELRYLIQKHDASRLHYDFRLELDGTLKSWAVTKGPSLDPADKRLAVHVEDHPLEYGSFEGTIQQGQYGGGTVMLWDEGTWQPLGNAEESYKKGRLSFILHGKRLKGEWHLVRMGGRARDGKRDNWLLIRPSKTPVSLIDDATRCQATFVKFGQLRIFLEVVCSIRRVLCIDRLKMDDVRRPLRLDECEDRIRLDRRPGKRDWHHGRQNGKPG